MIIGLSGYARSGKDTVADLLVGHYGFRKGSFAAPMYAAVEALDPYLRDNGAMREAVDHMHLSDLRATYGMTYDQIKASKWGADFRRIMQNLGTEVGRKQFGENFWVDQALVDIQPGEDVVFSDCRFPNEADAMDYVVRIERPGVGPANDHVSEVGLDDWDFDLVVHNSGTLSDLEESFGRYRIFDHKWWNS